MELSTSIVWAGVMITIIGAYSRRQSIRNYIEANISESWINILGYAGGFMQLGAVAAVSTGWLKNTSPLYHGISLIGSSGLLLNAFYYGSNPALVINTIWMSMNIFGIVGGISNLEVLEDLTSLDLGIPISATA